MDQPNARQSRDPFAQLRMNTCEDRIAAGSLLDAWLETLLATAAPDPFLSESSDTSGLVSIGQRSVMTPWSGDRPGPDADRWGDGPVQGIETETTRGPNRSEPASSRLWTSIEDPLASDALPGVSAGGLARSTQLPPTADSLAAEITPSLTDTEPASSTGVVIGRSSAVSLQQTAEPTFHGVFVAPTAVALGGGTGPPATQVAGGTIREVTFSGSGLITVEADPGDPAYPAPPHWLDSDTNGVLDQPADRSLPVGYSRGDTARVSAVFKANFVDPNLLLPGYAFTSPQVRGDGPGSYDVSATSVALQGTDLVLGPTDLYVPFANHVAYFETFTISWETSLVVNTTTGERSWNPAGSSSNELYVTYAPPITQVFHTLIHNSTVAAQGATTREETISGVWGNGFEGRTTRREGIPLNYYKEWDTTVITSADLIRTKDGQCGAWAKYFLDELKAQGINSGANNLIELKPDYPPASAMSFLINNWNFIGDGSGPPGYPYINTLKDPTKPLDFMIKQNGVWVYDFATSEVIDQEGVPGQNTANPKSLFGNHFITRVDGIYYDPSYGQRYLTVGEWEDVMVAGFTRVFQGWDLANPLHFRWQAFKNGSAADVKVSATATY